MAGPEVARVSRKAEDLKKQTKYGTFRKKHLKNKKKNKTRKVDRKVPFAPSTGLHPQLLMVFLGCKNEPAGLEKITKKGIPFVHICSISFCV